MARDPWAVMDGSTRKVDAEDARVAIGGLWTPGSSAVNTLQGLRPGPGDPGKVAQTGTASINVLVNSFQGLVTATRGAGGYIVTEPAQLTVPILDIPADPSNQRNDLIIYRQADTYYGDGATLSGVIRVQGNPSGTPSDPSLAAYPDHILLARVRVTANTPTITNAMIDDLRPPWIVGAGGVQPIRTLTERATLSHWAGRTIYRIDKGWEEVSDGTAWRIRGLVTVTALADVTDPYTGQLVYLTTDSVIYRWSGSAWVMAIPVDGSTAATRHSAYYYQSGTPQTIPAGADQRVLFNSNLRTTSDITTTTVSGGTEFTFQRACWCEIHASVKWDASANDTERYLSLANSANTAIRYAEDSGPSNTATLALPIAKSISKGRPYNSGDKVTILVFQGEAIGVDLDNNYVENVSVSFRIMGL